jgi:bifunctional DNA-binding transcriptional regulator/antitoxin component of YhaV-PrlF toxin-antitoxin module
MPMSYIATFSSKGQLTFPSALRRNSKIKAGHKAIIAAHPDKKDTYVISLAPQMSLDEAFGALAKPVVKYTPIAKVRQIAGQSLGKKYAAPRR